MPTHIQVSSPDSVRASTNFLAAFLRSLAHPEWMPQGVNDWASPLVEGQVPVVLIHGTWLNSYNTWSQIAPALAKDGHRVFAFNYGRDTSALTGRPRAIHGTRAILDAQPEVAAFIGRVLERTEAAQVDLIAHSQGMSQARLYLSDSGGANPADPTRNRVRKLIAISPSHHGTTLSGLGSLGLKVEKRWPGLRPLLTRILGDAALDQLVDSETMRHINRLGDTVPGVSYTTLCTRFDEIVTPWRRQFLDQGPGATVRNVLVQEGAVRDFSDHLAILYSPRVIDFIREELDVTGGYRSTHPLVRGTVLPGYGALPQWRRRKK
ncbi:alpha/beta fold hydrolase [Corynebacterium sp. zg-331]|uniref:esterase/lipase family protein n=1 Tax=unclassified Corynebacterium TaxID=2624378 RepID=UPI00128DFFBB|nr:MULTISPECIES: alpha/beta fold hydrolase [unclassified Corynebacterium]MBC3186070.1 alpha/beta fold hydrolase [Corynebacterium sp. zg-331]MPV52560.1 alpha/beta fold hydrolase [Corynebacterium sp. zg331]